MGVRAVVFREIALDMTAVQIQVFQRSFEKLRREMIRIPEEIESPNPRNGAHRDLEAARPVDADSGRILFNPRFEMGGKRCGISLVSRHPKCQPERKKMLMTV